MSVNVRVKENKPYDVLHCLEAKDAQNIQRGLTDKAVSARRKLSLTILTVLEKLL